MKKRILATLLCAVMSLSLLAGCGDSSSSADTNGSSDGDKMCIRDRWEHAA